MSRRNVTAPREQLFQTVAVMMIVVASALVPLFFTTFGAQHFTLPKMLLVAVSAVIVLGVLTVASIVGSARLRMEPAISALLAVWTFLIVVSFVFAQDRNSGFFGHYPRHDGLISYLVIIGWFWAVQQLTWSEAALRRVMLALGGSGAFAAILALAQSAGLMAFPDQPASGRVAATLGLPVFLGSFLAVGSCALVVLALSEKRVAVRRALLAAAILMLPAIWLTASRSSLGAWFVGLGVILIFHRRSVASWRRAAVMLAVVALVFGFSQAWALRSSGETMAGAYTISRLEQAVAPRIVYTRAGVAVVATRPLLGAGPSNFPWAAQKHQGAEANRLEGSATRFDDAHNLWLQIAASLGLPALAGFILIIVWFFLTGLRLVKEEPLFLGPMAGVASILAFATFEPAGFVNMWLLMTFLGLAASRSIASGDVEARRLRDISAVAAPLAVFLIVTYVLGRSVAADLSFEAGVVSAPSDPALARLSFHNATARAPWVDIYYAYLGNGYIQQARVEQNAEAFKSGLGYLEKAVSVGPMDPENWNRLALAYQSAADQYDFDLDEKAKAAVMRSLFLSPDMAESHRAAAAVLISQGSARNALPYARKAVAIDPAYGEGWLWLGYTYEKLGRTADARRAYSKAGRHDQWRAAAQSRARLLKD